MSHATSKVSETDSNGHIACDAKESTTLKQMHAANRVFCLTLSLLFSPQAYFLDAPD